MAERKNQTIEEARRAMLKEKHMPKFYWVDVVRTAVYLQNLTSASGVSPHEQFGSIAYVHVSNENQRKLDAKAEKCILVDYSDE